MVLVVEEKKGYNEEVIKIGNKLRESNIMKIRRSSIGKKKIFIRVKYYR